MDPNLLMSGWQKDVDNIAKEATAMAHVSPQYSLTKCKRVAEGRIQTKWDGALAGSNDHLAPIPNPRRTSLTQLVSDITRPWSYLWLEQELVKSLPEIT